MVGGGVTLTFIVLAWTLSTTSPNKEQSSIAYVFGSLQAKSMDVKQKIRGPVTPRSDLAVIAVDDESLNKIGRWPWPRDKIALLIEELFKHGAHNVALDIMFTETSNDSANELLDQLEQLDKLPTKAKKTINKFTKNKRRLHDHDSTLSQTFEKHTQNLIAGTAYSIPKFQYFPHQRVCYDTVFEDTDEYTRLENIGYNVIRLSSRDDPKELDEKILSSLKQELSELPKDKDLFEYCTTWEKDNRDLKGWGLNNALPDVDSWYFNIPVIHQNISWAGFMNFEPGIDGVVREIPLIVKTGPFTLPSLSLAMAIKHAGGDGAQYTRAKNNKNPKNYGNKTRT